MASKMMAANGVNVAEVPGTEMMLPVDSNDYYISPTTEAPRRVCIQQAHEGVVSRQHSWYSISDKIYYRPIRNKSPIWARVGTWPKRSNRLWAFLIVPWLVCAFTSFIILFTKIGLSYFSDPSDSEDPKSKSSSDYDKFNYEYNGYAIVAANVNEALENAGRPAINRQDLTKQVSRPRELYPRQLFQLSDQPGHFRRISTAERLKRRLDPDNPTAFFRYLFVSYTTMHFKTQPEKEALLAYAERAARQLNLEFFWCTENLVKRSKEDENFALDTNDDDDTYEISDYVRNAAEVVIVVGRPHSQSDLSPEDFERKDQINKLLQTWGQRVWTFPEGLLSKNLHLWVRGDKDERMVSMSRAALLLSAWADDGERSRRLIDHYEGTAQLGRLELVTTLLEAFRHRTYQSEYRPGDRAYALMGLLSQRPPVHPKDSDFEAFARISLSNDSDNLLERLICVAPARPDQRWDSMDDAWGSKLWDFKPEIQVCGIAKDETVLISGVKAANVRWKDFKKLKVSLPSLLDSFLLFLYGLLSLLSIFYYPWFVERLINGELSGVDEVFDDDSRLVGFEGYMSLDDIERHIWGTSNDRLSWSPFGSPLSIDLATDALTENPKGKLRSWTEKMRKVESQKPRFSKMCLGKDPWQGRREIIEREASTKGHRIFTLIDTYNAEVILFTAERPPVAFLICGQEGGMARAVGVSYVHETAAVYRECVLRLQTPAIDCMHRMGRVRFGFKRPVEVSEYLNVHPGDVE